MFTVQNPQLAMSELQNKQFKSFNRDKILKYLEAYKSWHLPKNEWGRNFINHYDELHIDDHFYKKIYKQLPNKSLQLFHCKPPSEGNKEEIAKKCNEVILEINLGELNGVRHEFSNLETNGLPFQLGSYSKETWFQVKISLSHSC